MTMNGKCPHGVFNLLEGCPQCVAEYADLNSPSNIAKRINEAKEHQESNLHIVKVKYYSETSGELSGREYTYYSAEPLKLGDTVIVPVRDTTGKAQVSAVDVPETEILAFKDKLKTIPIGSKVKTDNTGVPNRSVPNETETVIRVDPGACLAPTYITALTLRPGEDIQAHDYFGEAMKLLDYAEYRTIKTLEDAQTATNDLSIISKLKKAMEAKRKEKLSPHEAQVKAIRDTYNYLMTPILEAERITRAKQAAFLQEQGRIQREQEEINRKRLEAAQAEMKLKGELTESLNLVEVTEAPERISTDLGVTGMVDHWVFEVVDFSQVPDEYKVIDSAMLNAIARKYHDSKKVVGIRFYNEPYLATRAKGA